MNLDFLFNTFNENKNRSSIIWRNQEYTYGDLINEIRISHELIEKYKIKRGSVVALEGDFSPKTISIFLALIENKNIIMPLTKISTDSTEKILEIGRPNHFLTIDNNEQIEYNLILQEDVADLYKIINQKDSPGLVLFSSGTSGEPKAAVHDFSKLLKKFELKRKSLRTINFLLFDHWGGLNTMLHILSNGGVLITASDRSPAYISELIEKHRIELLPASPTFLNLLLLSGTCDSYDLSSLQVISYGTEPMPKTTLSKLKKKFPTVKLLQTYGLIELGVMRSKSESDDSLWVKVGGEGYQTRIIDNILQIKAESAMLGYLNAPSPFTEDGWFNTGDEVLEKDGFIKILGRRSELINIGGEKVYPQEIENIIMEMDNVSEVTIYSEKNSIIGNIVCAKVTLSIDEDKKDFKKRLRVFCKERMQEYKIPVKIMMVNEDHYNLRFKKTRSN
jgi:long-chain acyl-CoA synthetase